MFKTRSQSRALAFIGSYLFFQWLVTLVILSLSTFVMVRSNDNILKIADFIHANKVPIFSFSAILFVLFLHFMHPLTHTKFLDIFNFQSARALFAYHTLQGIVLASVLSVGGLLAGHFSWLGFFLRLDELAITLSTAALFSIGFFAMIILEEFMLRRVLEPQLRRYGGTLAIIVASCVAYVALKAYQFDLTLLEMLNLAALNYIFMGIARRERSHMASGLFSASFFLTLHVLFGQPLLGIDMPGIFLLRATTRETPSPYADINFSDLLSGAGRGPENSLILTLLLVVYVSLPWMRTQIKTKRRTAAT